MDIHLEDAISIEDVSKVYKLYNKPTDRLKESLHPFGKKYHRDFYAVDHVSFNVKKNETLGIIGKNGSGKSTLLKMITGVLTPTSGLLKVNGKISALLELGAGFNPEYTGIENIYLNATIMGFSKEEINAKLEEILSFADIGDFVNQPVKMYSSGMFVRLAFAVAINVDPDILIVDEALSVGDMKFQQKCFRKLEEFKKTKTILFVSHDMAAVTSYCDRVVWLNEGKMLSEGSPKEIAKQYQAFMIDSNISKYAALGTNIKSQIDETKIDAIDPNLDVLGDNQAQIIGISLRDEITNEKTLIVSPGQKINLFIEVKANQAIQSPIVGFTLKNRLGIIVAGSNSYVQGQVLNNWDADKTISFCFNFQVPNLNQGQFTISPAVASGTQVDHIQHSWVHDALVISILTEHKHKLDGIITLENVKINQIN